VRAKQLLAEPNVISGRGIECIDANPDNKFLISFINGKVQEVRIYDSSGEVLLTKQYEQKTMPLSVKYHFTGLVLAQTSPEPKVQLLNVTDLEPLASFTHTGPIVSAVLDQSKPNPDVNVYVSALIFNPTQGYDRINFVVPSPPINFPPYPVPGSELTADQWINGEIIHEKRKNCPQHRQRRNLKKKKKL
jgi:hypothetical protein